jgi:hypothetical protein
MNDLQNNSATQSYRTEAETSERLRELEAKYDLFRYTVDGYSAWRLLRFGGVAVSLQALPFQKQVVSSEWRRFGKLVFPGILDLPAFLFPKRARYVVKTFSSALSEKENGYWKDVYFDDLLKELGNCFKIEVQNNPLFIDRRKTALIPITISGSTIVLLSAIFTKVLRHAGISQVASRIAADLQDEPDLHFLNAHIIADRLYYFYWSKRMYKWLLMRIRPEFVFVADTAEYAIWSAAKELGIKTVEFQHGIFSSNHPDALPGLALPYKSALIVPDKIFLYGDFWKREHEANGFYGQELCVVGNIRIDQYRKIRAAYRGKNRDDATCCIVLTTQGFAVKQLISFVSQFIDLAEGQLNYKLYIKLHPIYDRDRSIYDTVFASNDRVKVISGTDKPSTFDLLTRADLHLSISSACHYDALGLGVPTIVLALPNHEIVLNLVETGHAKLAHNPQDLFDIAMKWPDYSVPYDISSYYFKPDALNNIKRVLGLHT